MVPLDYIEKATETIKSELQYYKKFSTSRKEKRLLDRYDKVVELLESLNEEADAELEGCSHA